MNNEKTGSLIRDLRKQKGMTQKDLAQLLHITDRAVSKWERGLSAPDIGLLEPLAQALDITVTELLRGEQAPHTPEQEAAVREVLEYSARETARQKAAVLRRLLSFTAAAAVLAVGVCLFLLWSLGCFHVAGRYPSPNRETVTTVYSCRLGYGDYPAPGGFTLSDKGRFRGRTIYPDAQFRGLWWSPNGKYQVVSMDTEEGPQLALTDYSRNIGVNLSGRLEWLPNGSEFFADVPQNEDGQYEIEFEFLQWSRADPAVMLLYFLYTDGQGRFRQGYVWYDYEAGTASGEMEVMPEKTADARNEFLH
mgnify:CR=1 FL=1